MSLYEEIIYLSSPAILTSINRKRTPLVPALYEDPWDVLNSPDTCSCHLTEDHVHFYAWIV